MASGCDEERRPVAEFMREFIVFRSTYTISSLKKFTFAISSVDELLVYMISIILNVSSLAVCALFAHVT